MRHIDIREIDLLLPDGWEAKAKKALTEIEALPPDDRNEEIDKRANIWQELKDLLREYRHGKCWYCETIQERSDNAIDHYRPKGRVAECQNHEGYWWLAFDVRNYRFSCTHCNSRRKDRVTGNTGGKQDNFPLLDENNRAKSPQDDIHLEKPCLLDPTKAFDTTLLWFDQSGEAVPKYQEEERSRYYKRAKVSIDLYHLNFYDTKVKRKVLYNDILDLVEDGDMYFDKAADGDEIAEHSLDRVTEKLSKILERSSEYSAAAKAYLLGLRSNQPQRQWLESVIAACG